MKLIWTKSSLPLSVAIRGLLDEPVSHFGIVFDNGIVFHSNLMGTHIEWCGTFVKHCEIVYSIEFMMSLEEEEAIYQAILTTYDDKPYDWSAFFYFAYRGLLKKLFKVKLPKVNEFQSGDKFLCTELAGCLPDNIVSVSIKAEDLSIVSPYQLYLQIKAAQAEKDSV